MEIDGVKIVDTFAEAFPMKGTRVIVTAATKTWADIAAREMTGYATSVIACDAEAAIERTLSTEETPDGRPGVAVLVFAFDRDSLAKAVQSRVGQCVLTCPTTACFNGLNGDAGKQISVGGAIRYFGDSYQISKKLNSKRYWRIPVMDGEFLCEDKFGTLTGIGGGNLIICATDQMRALQSAEASVSAMQTIPDVIMPFPGGVVRSGSKVGSRYPKLRASTNENYCPTLRPHAKDPMPENCNAVYEIVIDGFSFEAIQSAMHVGLHAAARVDGVVQISAGNYGGKLGKHHFHLRELLDVPG